MSNRARTIQWCEGKIISELSKRQIITTYLALSANVLRNVRTLDEQHNLDIALINLLSRRQIAKDKDKDGFTIFKLVA